MNTKIFLKKFLKRRNKKTVFYSVTIGLAIIFLWKGVTDLVSMYILPNNIAIRSVLLIIISISILYFNDNSLEEMETL
ncbi:hypothetical protein K9M42_00635 [Patescibacteria group bacterium]|nr:hypothetical protein [Patescibacteria group bacterium]